MFDAIDARRRRLDALRPFEGAIEARLDRLFRPLFIHRSNAIEGNTLTFGETLTVLRDGRLPGGKRVEELKEVLGQASAYDYLRRAVEGRWPLTEKLIREIHTLLTHDLEDVHYGPGTYKTRDNRVLQHDGTVFPYVSHVETPAAMRDLLDWLKDVGHLHPIQRAAELHYRFILIHPFQDGNGRTVRMLVNLVLLQAGLTPAFTRPEELQGYEGGYRRALLAVDRSVPMEELSPAAAFDVRPLVAFLEEEVLWSLDRALDVVEGRVALTPDDFARRFAQVESRVLGGATAAVVDEVGRRRLAGERVKIMKDRLLAILSPVVVQANAGLRVTSVRLHDDTWEPEVLRPSLQRCLGTAGLSPAGPIGGVSIHLGPAAGASVDLAVVNRALTFVVVAEPHVLTLGAVIEGEDGEDAQRLLQPPAPERWRAAEIEGFVLGRLNDLLDGL